MTGTLILFAVSIVFLYAAQYFFPIRKFSPSAQRSHLFFHIGMLVVVIEQLVEWLPFLKMANHNEWSTHRPPIIKFLTVILGLDLFSYFWHRANHKLNFLWKWHKFHHQTEVMDPLAAYRFHPIEIFLGYKLRALVILMFGFSVETVTVFITTYGLFNIYQHSNFKTPKLFDEVYSLIFVSPSRHHVHHLRDRQLQNSNYATIFIFWDRLFGSYEAPRPIHDNDIGLE